MYLRTTLYERGRRRLGYITTAINVTIVFMGVCLLAAALGIKYKLDSRMEHMQGYDSGALAYYLVIVAVLAGAGHMYAAGKTHAATQPETRSTEHHKFVALLLGVLILMVLVLISEIVLLVHSSKIHAALEDGIRGAMQAYKSDLPSKMRVDYLQLEFECCGVKSYEDWFTTAWVSLAYVNVEDDSVKKYLRDGEFVKDDAPFSCCSRRAKRACIHHSVLEASAHAKYDITLNERGCAEAVSAHFHDAVIMPTGLLLLVMMVAQLTCLYMMRLLQTSIRSADEMGDTEGPGPAYVWSEGDDKNAQLFKSKGKRKGSEQGDEEQGGEDDEGERRKGKQKRSQTPLDNAKKAAGKKAKEAAKKAKTKAKAAAKKAGTKAKDAAKKAKKAAAKKVKAGAKKAGKAAKKKLGGAFKKMKNKIKRKK